MRVSAIQMWPWKHIATHTLDEILWGHASNSNRAQKVPSNLLARESMLAIQMRPRTQQLTFYMGFHENILVIQKKSRRHTATYKLSIELIIPVLPHSLLITYILWEFNSLSLCWNPYLFLLIVCTISILLDKCDITPTCWISRFNFVTDIESCSGKSRLSHEPFQLQSQLQKIYLTNIPEYNIVETKLQLGKSSPPLFIEHSYL